MENNQEKDIEHRLQDDIKLFIKKLLYLKDGVDYEGSEDRIEGAVEFKGFNVWILIMSIFIASIGLNANSTSVIIGAMLISPLMGPIVGMGFGMGTNDFKLMKKAFTNFLVMIGISLTTSYLYFLISPIDQAYSEILGRTSPTILDVLIAVFGGAAGILAATRKGLTNVVPGVAIATALMPPLCTAGFGLANDNFTFFWGAMYLFTLNCLFIALSAAIFIRYFKFPLKSYVNKNKERRVKVVSTIITLVAIIPATFIFMDKIKQVKFEQNAQQFVREVIEIEQDNLIRTEFKWNDSLPEIKLLFTTLNYEDEHLEKWQNALNDYKLGNTKLHVLESNQLDLLEELDKKNGIEENVENLKLILEQKNKQIALLEETSMKYKSQYKALHDFELDPDQLQKELLPFFPDLDHCSFGLIIEPKDAKLDTVSVMHVHWSRYKGPNEKNRLEGQLKKWLDARHQISEVYIIQQ